MTIQEARQQAKSIVKEAVDPLRAREEKISAIAKQLELSYAKAESLVKQEESRKAASERYRQSDSYKQRLQQQKVVRQLLKGAN